MLLQVFSMGSFEVNTVVIGCEETRKAAIFDYGGHDLPEITAYLKANNLEPEALYLTHGHLDHTCGAREIQEKLDLPVFIHKEDRFLLGMLRAQLLMYGLPQSDPPKKVEYFINEPVFKIGNLEMTVIHTPGHSPGSVCYYFKDQNILLSGDTIFMDWVGRTDLPGGNEKNLIKSIKEKLLPLPDETIVYSGHGEQTTMGRERKHNNCFGTLAKEYKLF